MPIGAEVSYSLWAFWSFLDWRYTLGCSTFHQPATWLSGELSQNPSINCLANVSLLTCDLISSSLSTPLPATLDENTPQLMHHLWKPFLHDLNATEFLSKEGYSYKINKNNQRWPPLKKKLLILDVDTRLDTGAGAMMNKTSLNANEMTGRTAGMMNHYLYGMSSPSL